MVNAMNRQVTIHISIQIVGYSNFNCMSSDNLVNDTTKKNTGYRYAMPNEGNSIFVNKLHAVISQSARNCL
jgi:hypothetical protein